jgi:hypothetical protein
MSKVESQIEAAYSFIAVGVGLFLSKGAGNFYGDWVSWDSVHPKQALA